MIKIIAIISVIFVFMVLPVLILYAFGNTVFLDDFFKTQMIPLLGTIMALNFAISTSLSAILYNIEDKENKNIFIGTRKEIKQNLIFMIIVFVFEFLLQVINVPKSTLWIYPLIAIKLLLFFLYFYAVFDLNEALFCISENKN